MWSEKFRELKCCVIIPTYNNSGTLSSIISGVLKFTDSVIVVNDGSTDGTSDILKQFQDITVVTHEVNKGKGIALRTGFKKAVELDLDYAVTIDSDGQHNPEDLPNFIEKIEKEPGSLIVGARNMEQSTVPGKSSFGHKFSNFWYKVETGIDLPDTQSGYRLYPVKKLKDIRYITNRFEFEIEVIVRAAWAGIKVTHVPVSVIYFPKETRVSHFRPVRDFTRVSILNTILVFLAFTIFRPLMYIRDLKKKSAREIVENILGSNESALKISSAVALGGTIGVSPFWGFQIMLILIFAHILKLNKVTALIASHISIPPFIPFIIYYSYVLGGYFYDSEIALDINNLTLESVSLNIVQYVTGSFVLMVVTGILFFAVTFPVIKIRRKKRTA
jgi:glycosyltransferase involved in cell wall biosynthesis